MGGLWLSLYGLASANPGSLALGWQQEERATVPAVVSARGERLLSARLLSCRAARPGPVARENKLLRDVLSVCLVSAGFWPLPHRVWDTRGMRKTRGARPHSLLGS